MNKPSSIREHRSCEDGYMLIAAMFLLFVFALSLSIAAPLIAKSIQRDREMETMERGKQYQRAIQLYYRKFGAYPPSLDALVKTNNIRFLRKKYVDPLTGKSDWKPILFGQNKAPMAMGFFGQPLAGGATAVAGTGPTGGNAAPNSGLGSMMGSGSARPGGIGGSSIFSGTSSFGGSSLGSTGTPSSGASGTTMGAGAQAGTTGTSGTTSGAGTGSTSGTSSGVLGSSGGQTFGGAGVVGVAPPVDKASILIYKKKQKYSEWEFTYSPLSDQMKQAGGNTGTVGQPASSLGRPFGSSPTSSPNSNPTSTGTMTPQPQR